MEKIPVQASAKSSCKLTRQFQQKMNDLIHRFGFIRVCIDDILIRTKVDWNDHICKLESTLNKLKEK